MTRGEMLREAAEAGDAEAMEKLAYRCRWGIHGPVDEAEALRPVTRR